MDNIREKEEKENIAIAISIMGLLAVLVYFELITNIVDIIYYAMAVFIAIFLQVIWREKKNKK